MAESPFIHEISDTSFDTEVVQANLPTLVDFWAEWCNPCKMISPVLENIASDYQGKLKVTKLNVDHNKIVPAKLGIRGIPTLMLYKEGKVVSTKSGYMSKTQIEAFLEPYLDNK